MNTFQIYASMNPLQQRTIKLDYGENGDHKEPYRQIETCTDTHTEWVGGD